MADRAPTKRRVLKVDALARVEGEGAMSVRIRGDRVEEVALRIYEPPALLRGVPARARPHRAARHHRAHLRHLPDRLPDELGAGDRGGLRRARSPSPSGCCAASSTAASGSRATGCTSTCSTRPTSSATTARSRWPRTTPSSWQDALQMKKAGNELIDVVGGRAIHPVNVRVGGLYRAPTRARARARRRGAQARPRDGARHREAHRRPGLPALRARLHLRRAAPGGRLPARARPGRLEQRPRHPRLRVRGPLRGRSRSRTRPRCTRTSSARATTWPGRWRASSSTSTRSRRSRARRRSRPGVGPDCRNPFQSIVVRAVEMLYACDEALRLIEAYEPFDPPAVEFEPARRPRLRGDRGAARAAVPALRSSPRTARSSARRSCRRRRRTRRRSRRTWRSSWAQNLDLDDDALRHRCEQAIRNYDPCISCATHFLTLDMDRA